MENIPNNMKENYYDHERKQHSVELKSCGLNDLTPPQITAIIMASGHGKRFGSNKLLEDFGGKALIENLFGELPCENFLEVFVVSLYDEVLELAGYYGFSGIKNTDTTDDTAVTIKLGCANASAQSEGLMFFAADQPLLKRETVVSLIETFASDKSRIVVPVCGGKRGNPVIFPVSMKEELLSLSERGRGRDVIERHAASVVEVYFDKPEEFFDIDFREDIKTAKALQGLQETAH